jgi:hypothetical protein
VLTKPLKVIDLTKAIRLERLSIFDAAYDPNREWAPDFIREFSKQVSKPVEKDDDPIGYVPTQMLAEFIRHRGYQGIQYISSQCERGRNVVILDGPSDEDYRHLQLSERFTEWMRLKWCKRVTVTSVSYRCTRSVARCFSEGQVRRKLEKPLF